MEEFLAVLERVMIVLQDSGPGMELTGQNLNLTAKEKLSEEDVQSYKYWLIDHSLEDTFDTLVEWVELRVQIMEEAKEETRGLGKKRNDNYSPEDRRVDKRDDKRRFRGFSTTSKPWNCIVTSCAEAHPPWACKAFKSLSVSERKELIVKAKRCFRCLAAGHMKDRCPNARRCGIDGCSSNQHSSYLHESKREPSQNQTANSTDEGQPCQKNSAQQEAREAATHTPPSVKKNSHATKQADHVSLMVLPAIIENGNRRLRVNVMLDPCSTGSYVTDAAAEELMLQGESQSLTITGTGGSEVTKTSRRVELVVTSLENDFTANLQANVLDNITSDTPAFEWSKLKERWPHLTAIPFQNIAKRRQIDVLIGSDHPVFHQVVKEQHGTGLSDPVARQTKLGWVCFGPALVEEYRRTSRSLFTRTYRCSSQVKEQEALKDVFRQFWELDAIGIKEDNERSYTLEEKAALTQVAESLKLEHERYTIGIPWRAGEPKLINNCEMAFSRLTSQEKSLKRKGPETMSAYNQIIQDYEKKGYVKKVPKTDEKDQWLLPHFPVVREDKTTTKVRIVFDAAAKHDGKSLNDAVRPGPKLQREVTDVLTRFRRAPVVLTGDISEMFLQVALHEKDRKYHRFLWRNFDGTREPEVYEFQRLTFGNRSSPFCSQYVLQTHAQSFASTYPEAAETVDNSMYVDDVLDSFETVEEAKHLRSQLSELLAKAGFKLRKWASNEPTAIEDVSLEDRLSGISIDDENPPKIKTLGVIWEAERDVFTFHAQLPDVSTKPTKREVLREIATLFDPLQFLSPFTIRAKVLMQEIWTAGIDWDDVLPDKLVVKWKRWISELHDLSRVAIPRCLRLADPTEKHLHLFSDASEKAYAAVAYLVCRYSDKSASSCIVASKSRVSPVRAMTIPRLELMGAVLAARLAKNITKTLEVDDTTFWTDSSNVVYWVRNQSREFKPFVANRVGEIHNSTNPEQWRHVPGEINPADLPTRGLSVAELAESKLWIEGPEMLKADESIWPEPLPNKNSTSQIDQERKNITTHLSNNVTDHPKMDPANYSDFLPLIRITAWVQRFLTNCRLPESSRVKVKILRVTELKKKNFFG